MALVAAVSDREESTAHEKSIVRRGGRAPELERVTVNLVSKASRALQVVSELTGDTKTDSINRAIQIYAYLEDLTAQGGTIYIRQSDGDELQQLKFF
jgi:hypothetical protein